MLTTLICVIAALLKTIAFVPQAIKTLKSGDASSISLQMYLLTAFGVCCWIIYGYDQGNAIIVISNLITLVLCLPIIAIKLQLIPRSWITR